GMVRHARSGNSRQSPLVTAVNGVGAVATGVALVVVLVAKFVAGAWITMLLIPAVLYLFVRTKRHYDRVAEEIACSRPLDTSHLEPPIVIVPVNGWNRQAELAMRLAISLSKDVVGLYISTGEDEGAQSDTAVAEALGKSWEKEVTEPCRSAGLPAPALHVVKSPYRQLFKPLLDLIDDLKEHHPGRTVAVIIPEMVETRWYELMLHNQRAATLKAALLFSGRKRVAVISIPWYIQEGPGIRGGGRWTTTGSATGST
ncbi:MAG: APC family permease, partial [Cyanobacteria bacterium REEB65]|nr:APC family permease [Cyanobacteria bacterium REEB65]